MILNLLVKLFLIHHLNQTTKTLCYNLIQSNHPSNTKKDGVCIYYKETMAICLVDITSQGFP